jgi:antitoxin HicB
MNLHLTSHYTIVIQWSAQDQCFVVSLPEWGDHCHTHGNTYPEALQNAQEVLELLIESTIAEGDPLPAPQLFEHKQVENNQDLREKIKEGAIRNADRDLAIVNDWS